MGQKQRESILARPQTKTELNPILVFTSTNIDADKIWWAKSQKNKQRKIFSGNKYTNKQTKHQKETERKETERKEKKRRNK
jgi:hypothetical protein